MSKMVLKRKVYAKMLEWKEKNAPEYFLSNGLWTLREKWTPKQRRFPVYFRNTILKRDYITAPQSAFRRYRSIPVKCRCREISARFFSP